MSNTNNETETKLECVWNMGTNCSDGEVKKYLIFDKQLNVPMCTQHYGEHLDVMILARNDYDVEKVLEMTSEDRRREVLTLELSGMNITDVEP